MGKHIAVKLWANANIWHRENGVDCLWKKKRRYKWWGMCI